MAAKTKKSDAKKLDAKEEVTVKNGNTEATAKNGDAKLTVKQGDTVKVHYTGTLEDGTVFDSSESHGTPLEFQIGANQVIPGFENAMVGMKEGEEKDVKLSVADAYGEYNPQMIRKVPKAQLPKDHEPKIGMILMVGLPNGMQVPVKIVAVDAESVSIDLNHPLAGKALNFKIKVLEVCNHSSNATG